MQWAIWLFEQHIFLHLIYCLALLVALADLVHAPREGVESSEENGHGTGDNVGNSAGEPYRSETSVQRLEVLKLDYDSCVGKQWELPEDDKFCQLIVLEINSTHLKDWKATGDNFPKLEHLYLFSCTKLKEIPKGFAEISKLKSIQLVDCRPSVVASAEEIKEEQLDYLNNIVDVVVAEERGYSSVSESESESDEYESDEA
nr:putative late blight resistance protein homolog R1A-4 isoform X2 [Ipomoea trifida]